jgi:cell division protein FtsL
LGESQKSKQKSPTADFFTKLFTRLFGGKMGRMYVLSYGKTQVSGIKKRTLPREITIGPTAIKFVAIIIFAALGVIYLTQSTRGANLSVELGNLDSEQQELQQKIERLNAEGARLKALDNVYSQTGNMQMEPASKINYLPADQQVAKNN